MRRVRGVEVSMNAMMFAGVSALAVGVVLVCGGIGFVARDELLGWLGIAIGPAPLGLGYWLLRDKPTEEPR